MSSEKFDLFHYEKYAEGAYLEGDILLINNREICVSAKYTCCAGLKTPEFQAKLQGKEDGWEIGVRTSMSKDSFLSKFTSPLIRNLMSISFDWGTGFFNDRI